MEVKIVSVGDLSERDIAGISFLHEECFNDVPEKEKKENFIAKSFAEAIAYEGERVTGTLHLFKRKVRFEDKDIVLGGMGGVCVTKSERGRGVATEMLKLGMEELKKEKCDIACLNVDLYKKIYGLYEKLGFVMMNRPISYENIHSKIIKDVGSMFVSILSKGIFDLVIKSKNNIPLWKGLLVN